MVIAGYFVYLIAAAVLARAPLSRRVRVIAISSAVLCVFYFFGSPHLTPLAYLLAGYWLPASLATAPDPRIERLLARSDRQLLGASGLDAVRRRAPRAVLESLEAAYLLCYAVLPAGYVWFVAEGLDRAADRYWATVLLASFLCYGWLPWIRARAPRVLEHPGPDTRSLVRRLNLAVLDRASVQWNTFPSGHTAASASAAFAVGAYSPAAGILFGLVALGIAAGSVIGRYHYAADAIAGALVAAAAFVTASAGHAP